MTHTRSIFRFDSGRRRAFGALAAAALLPVGRLRAQASALTPTPSQAEGPFYPKTFPADRDADLTQIAGRTAKAQGTPLYLSGRTLTRDGRPLANAMVELWQCDVYGRYHHAGDEGVPRDDNFQGYGVVITDSEGPLCVQDDPACALQRTAAAHSRTRAPRAWVPAHHADLHCRRCGRR